MGASLPARFGYPYSVCICAIPLVEIQAPQGRLRVREHGTRGSIICTEYGILISDYRVSSCSDHCQCHDAGDMSDVLLLTSPRLHGLSIRLFPFWHAESPPKSTRLAVADLQLQSCRVAELQLQSCSCSCSSKWRPRSTASPRGGPEHGE